MLSKSLESCSTVENKAGDKTLTLVVMCACNPDRRLVVDSKTGVQIEIWAPYPSMIDVMAGKQVMRVLSDYLDGVAPPVPLLDLEMESGRGVRLSGILQRYDGNTQIESWVFPVTVNNVVDMYEKAGIRLFARNIRGFLGSTKVNRSMEVSLEKEPEFFWYYNNGITIVCDAAERLSSGGRDVVRVTNPQVINGQQTTRTLHGTASANSRASVLVRVISVPRDNESDGVRFEKLVSKIVAATNWQNQIRASDLMVNDRRQIEIERNFRKIDYQYLRKRQTKGEARREAGVRHRFLVSKEEIAQAVAACDLDPSIVRGGKERLFEERNYTQVFPNSDPLYYLPRYWVADHVAYAARGYPERAYAKWLVVHFMWHCVASLLASRSYKDAFRRETEKEYFLPLLRSCDLVFKSALAFFRSKRGRGETAMDVSTFFQRRGLHTQFFKFWRSSANSRRAKFHRTWKRFAEELKRSADE